jgi:hypothetical protein
MFSSSAILSMPRVFVEYIIPGVLLLVSYPFLLAWIGMVPVYLYNEFTFSLVKPVRGRRQDVGQTPPAVAR